MSRLKTIAIFLTVYLAGVDPARILGVYPMPSISHQVVFRALTLELVNKGHEVVAITTDPLYKGKESPKNLTEIDISDSYQNMMKAFMNADVTKYIKRGVIISSDAMTPNAIVDLINVIFDNPDVDKLIKDKSQKFDLVIIEALAYTPLIFSKLYNAPAILFSSLYGTPSNYEAIGGVSRHPVIYPNMFRQKYRNLSILDTIRQLHMEYKLWTFDQHNLKEDNKFLKNRFGPDTPSIEELKKNVALLLVNAHPIFDGNRPVPPAAVYLGAVHMQPKKDLPQDLKTYLDSSTRGVVYVSLGTNVRPSYMTKDFLDAFLDAFEKLPYDILWKFDGDSLEKLPKNVKIQKWFPQRDLLFHPNIKLFVMQGGLQSTDEAIDAEVPLVGIPMLGDQWYNTDKYVELGIGVALDSFTMVADDLVKAVHTVANDPSYKENIKKLRAVMQDRPETPIERAVWWTEHVLRHKGSRHLIGSAAQLSWSEYLMLDVLAAAAVVFTILAAIALGAVFYIVKLLMSLSNSVKVKKH